MEGPIELRPSRKSVKKCFIMFSNLSSKSIWIPKHTENVLPYSVPLRVQPISWPRIRTFILKTFEKKRNCSSC